MNKQIEQHKQLNKQLMQANTLKDKEAHDLHDKLNELNTKIKESNDKLQQSNKLNDKIQ